MFSVHLDVPSSSFIEDSLINQKFIKKKNQYVLNEKSTILINAIIDSSRCKLTLEFSPQLNLEQYARIHQVLSNLIEDLSAVYDDTNSLLGYLKNGEGAYILTNWHKWIDFLQQAKLKTLEGKKVRILDENQLELATGLFVGYQKNENSAVISKCTVITLFGERTFKGTSLTIEATNEW
ncbi:hypothetical protein [Bacillus sp. 2205SS5-2]|uniref:hypothetical protein n=1 Tax=Bacillus sp. 2205SS5-2 TaxID=3109031 RepID=UPI003007EC47